MRVRFYLSLLLVMAVCSGCQSQETFQPIFKCTIKLHDPYGICTHIHLKGSRHEFDSREQDLDMIKSIGATWIRTDWDWNLMITKQAGLYSFDHFDQMMETVDYKRLNALAIITLRPNFKKSNQDEWKDFIRTEVNHFKQVKNWEILNEVDLIRGWYPDVYAMDYVKLLKSGYQAVKEGNKKANVLFSGLANTDSQYLDSILCENVGEYFDIMNVHRYNHKKSEPEELLAYFQRLHDKLEKYHINKPVWLTESGCTTLEGWNTEKEQAYRLPRIYLISFACGIDKVFWYRSRSRELNLNDPEDFFGLWHKDYSPKPAYYAYRTLTKMCPSKSIRPKLEKNGKVYVASWKRPDAKKVWAMWTSKSDEKVELNIKGKYKIYDLKGDEIHQEYSGFNISPSVTYIVGAKNIIIN